MCDAREILGPFYGIVYGADPFSARRAKIWVPFMSMLGQTHFTRAAREALGPFMVCEGEPFLHAQRAKMQGSFHGMCVGGPILNSGLSGFARTGRARAGGAVQCPVPPLPTNGGS